MHLFGYTIAFWAVLAAPLMASDLERLLDVYATAPQGYPEGPGHARPDVSVPFRWHFYHAGAIDSCLDAAMRVHVDAFNPLEDGGVRLEKDSQAAWKFVAEHATHGKHALRVEVTAAAIKAGAATVRVDAVAGGASFSEYLRARGLLATRSSYGPHYRWIKFDVFNPGKSDVRLRVSGAPFLVAPGASTLAVKMADAIERNYQCLFNSIPIRVDGPEADVVLFLDNVRMEQELPETLTSKGRMFQFPGRADAKDPPVLAPGFTAIESDTMYTPERGFGWTQTKTTRQSHGHSFRSNEHGLLWGCMQNTDAPLRIDMPKGRYGVVLFGAPTGGGFSWAKGLSATLNGTTHPLLAPRDEAEVRRMALGGEAWEFRPGACVWEALVRPPYYPTMPPIYADATNEGLLLELPKTLALHALFVFPEADKKAALRELGRLNYLLAESWDVSHPWVRGAYAQRCLDGFPYIGFHEEMLHPESIPARLQALKLTADDFRRGFVLFERGLIEPVYPDTIPTPRECAFKSLHASAAPGERVAVTLGLLPLAPVNGLRVAVESLAAVKGEGSIAAKAIGVRVARQHQKTMQFGHHNHDYNYAEQYLVRRPSLDVHPGAARRIYLDIAVPDKLAPGLYKGSVVIRSALDAALATVPLVLEVLPFTLEEPDVYFASSNPDPRLRAYGINAIAGSYDEAEQHGFKAYLANMGGTIKIKGASVGWSHLAASKALVEPLIEAGRKGKGPRGFFGGIVPGAYGKPNASAITSAFHDALLKEMPLLDLPGRTAPAFHFGGAKGLQIPHEWIVLAAAAQPHSAEALAAARAAGQEFWFVDGLRHAKEHAARFTFGAWFWHSGAKGRFTTLAAHLQYGGGTARPTYRYEPYFTLLDVTTCNVDRAIMESQVEDEWNPSRDLILLRAGIDDYRYLHTLDHWLKAADATRPGDPLAATAKTFRARLKEDLSLDLRRYYRARGGAYGENWYPLADNPWTQEKFDQLRRELAAHITAVQNVVLSP